MNTGHLAYTSDGQTKSIESQNGFEFNLRFAGQYYDAETGYHYNYHRYYDPSIGRYLTSDPIGLMGGMNTYSYVDNEPWRYVDIWGLSRADVLKIQKKFYETVKQMTKNGQRMESKTINNSCRSFPWFPGCADNVKDCGEQTEYMNSVLSAQKYDDNWIFLMDAGIGHAWGVAVSSNRSDPVLWYDTRANEFSIDSVCPSCKPWWGDPVYGEQYLRNMKVPPKK